MIGRLTSYDLSGQLIVREHFDYMERLTESKLVVNSFLTRQHDRSHRNTSADKSINRLVAIPAAPGLGKSTFLVHFPNSKCYQEYCGNIPPIVAPVSFNGVMTECHFNSVTETPTPTFGLRILFGAATTMRSPNTALLSSEEDTLRWIEFLELFKSFCNLSAIDSVRILRKVYGDNRRILLLIDELSKATPHDVSDKAIMKEIGSVLDYFGDVDAIVSSLSLEYVKDVLTDTKRPIQYVILGSLLNYGLGHKECVEWANYLLSKLGK